MFWRKLPRLCFVGLNFTVRRGATFIKCCGELIGLLSFVVDPGVLKRVLKHGPQAGLESGLDLTSGYNKHYYLYLVFPLIPPPDCR